MVVSVARPTIKRVLRKKEPLRRNLAVEAENIHNMPLWGPPDRCDISQAEVAWGGETSLFLAGE